jgi:hypothetical protein
MTTPCRHDCSASIAPELADSFDCRALCFFQLVLQSLPSVIRASCLWIFASHAGFWRALLQLLLSLYLAANVGGLAVLDLSALSCW